MDHISNASQQRNRLQTRVLTIFLQKVANRLPRLGRGSPVFVLFSGSVFTTQDVHSRHQSFERKLLCPLTLSRMTHRITLFTDAVSTAASESAHFHPRRSNVAKFCTEYGLRLSMRNTAKNSSDFPRTAKNWLNCSTNASCSL